MLESLLRHRARIRDSVAVKVGNQAYTYSQLDALSSSMAAALIDLGGIRGGDMIVTSVKAPLDHLALFFAVRKVGGAIMVPVNPRLGGRSFMDFVINDVKPALVIDDYQGMGISSSELNRGGGKEGEFGFRMNLEETAMILYTGGTTGPPKGAMIHEAPLSGTRDDSVVLGPHQG